MNNQESKLSVSDLPLIAVTMGDPASIGPEIVVKALTSGELKDQARVIVSGQSEYLLRALEQTGIPLSGTEGWQVRVVADPAELSEEDWQRQVIYVWQDAEENAVAEELRLGCPPQGEISLPAGRLSYIYIEQAHELAMSGKVTAIATAPINKESLRAAAVPYIGHTEILAGLTGTDDPLTVFEVRGLRVFFLTRHVSLRRACDLVTKERIVEMVPRCLRALEELGVPDSSLAIAGLNPHSGESGLFGWEEVKEIVPAIEQLQRNGYNVVGPIGADSVFHLALIGRYGSVLSLYHDQGHIATKTLDFERTIALTCGMPYLRTSVDHGTALDIAGKNMASAISMIEAIKLAAKYGPSYRRKHRR
ncbi:MAG: 4-phospho-D-threonate 3-dehydrogenase [Clostridiaceae bacterium]|nr:4-phospho-D-threonate 3-dehydrogenase [Clostridiaceae bacterium]